MAAIDFEKMQKDIEHIKSQLNGLIQLSMNPPEQKLLLRSKEIAKMLNTTENSLRQYFENYVKQGYPVYKKKGIIYAKRKELVKFINYELDLE